MKKILRILLVLVLLILAAAVILPFALKGKIISMAKAEINQSVNAQVDFEDIRLGIFSTFPHLNLGIENLSVINYAPFEGDTLFATEDLSITIDIMSALSGTPYEIRKISVKKPNINLLSLKDGTVNWDIAKEASDEDTAEAGESSEDAFTLSLRHLSIRSGKLVYKDASLPFYLSMEGMDHDLSGDLSASSTVLETNTTAERLVMIYDGVPYLNGVKATVNTGFDADLENFIFNFRDGEIKINDLLLLASGTFGMPEGAYDMDLNFSAPGTAFSEILSLVPAIYTKDFDQLETRGTFALAGSVKGQYSETSMPGFQLNLSIQDGYFKYPDLPSAVEEVSVLCEISNPDGIPDHTNIDLSELHLLMAGAPLDAELSLSTPVSDPRIKASLSSLLDLKNVAAFYPLENTDLSGMIDAKISLDGNMSSVEKQDYNSFDASGSIVMENIRYISEGIPSILVPSGKFIFSPQRLVLEGLRMQAGNTALSAGGALSNYLGWFLKNEILQGNFDVIAGTIDLNEYMGDEEVMAEDPGDTAAMSVVHIPENINFTLTTQAEKIIFGETVLKEVRGKLVLSEGTLVMEDIFMKALQGSIIANGSYTAPEGSMPYIDMMMDIRDISIAEAYEQSGLMRRLAPVAKHTTGRISTGLKLRGRLDEEMMPEFSSLAGGGSLSTSPLIIRGMPVLTKIGEMLSLKEFQEATLDAVKATFEFKDGRVELAPFTLKTKNTQGEVWGSTGFDQSIDYTINLELPRNVLGNAAEALISSWTKQAADKGLDIKGGDLIKIAILIGGTITDPQIKTGFKDMASTLKQEIKELATEKIEEVKQEVREEIGKKAEELIQEAKLQGEKLMKEARLQAENIRKAGTEAAAKLRAETNKEADKIVAEGKKNGPIAAAIAEKAAEQLKKEGDDKAKKLEAEANTRADGIVSEAQKKSDAIIKEAEKKAEQI